MSWLKGIRPNSVGNTRLAHTYGGSDPVRAKGYANGGVVGRIAKAFGGGLGGPSGGLGGPSPDALGSPAKKNLGHKGRKAKSKSQGNGSNKNTIIVMPQGGAGAAPHPMPALPGAAGPPPPPGSPGPMAMGPRPPVPPMPAPGAGGPPRLAAFGGRIRSMFNKGGRVGKPGSHHGGVVGKPKGVGHEIAGESVGGTGKPKYSFGGKGFLHGDQKTNTSTAATNKDTPKGGTKNVHAGAYDKFSSKWQTSNKAENNKLPPAPKHRIADHNELKEDRGHDTTNQKLAHGGKVHHDHDHKGDGHHHHGGHHDHGGDHHDGHHGHHEAHHGHGKHHISHHTKGHHVEVHHHHHKKGGHVHKHDGGKVHPRHELEGGGVKDASSEGDHFDILKEKHGGDVHKHGHKHHHREHHRYGGKAGGRMSEHEAGGGNVKPSHRDHNQEINGGVLEAVHEDGHEKDVHLHEKHGGDVHHHRRHHRHGGRIPPAGNMKGAGLHNADGGAGSGPGREEKIERFGE